MEAVTIWSHPVFFRQEITPAAQTRNVVLFGECGVGKSSIINAIVGRPVAKTSNDVLGCTDETASYPVSLDAGISVTLWDTAGLDEGTAGRIPADQAKQRLKAFLQRQIATPEGVDLLLYCIQGANDQKSLTVKRGHWERYKFVFEEVCKKRVPIAMIVTHLESYDPGGDMETWWDRNEGHISNFGFQLCAHACVAVLPPELWSTNENVDRLAVSRRRLQDILSRPFVALHQPRNVLLLGDREDRNDFIDTTVASCNNQNPNHKAEGVSPFTCIPIAFNAHTHINLWNTSGFNETDDDALVTERNLKLIVQGIRQTPGVDLLVFCFRAGRVKVRHAQNYNLFYTAICRKKVPVAIVVLGPDEGADTWWQRNKQDLGRRGLRFDRHLYIPCDPSQLSGTRLDDAARHRLAQVMQEEHTLGSWRMGSDPFWVTVPNVRAVVGELSWPTITVAVCDATTHNTFADMAPNLQTALRRPTRPQREHRFHLVDPQTLSAAGTQSSDSQAHRASRIIPESDHRHKSGHNGTGLLMFFVSAEESALDDGTATWRTLERFYAVYRGAITPLVVVVCGVPQRRLAVGFWGAAPRHIRRRIGAYVTHHPGPSARPEAQAAAQEIMVDMIRDRCLVDLGEKVGILQEILSIWRKYRSQRSRAAAADGT